MRIAVAGEENWHISDDFAVGLNHRMNTSDHSRVDPLCTIDRFFFFRGATSKLAFTQRRPPDDNVRNVWSRNVSFGIRAPARQTNKNNWRLFRQRADCAPGRLHNLLTSARMLKLRFIYFESTMDYSRVETAKRNKQIYYYVRNVSSKFEFDESIALWIRFCKNLWITRS